MKKITAILLTALFVVSLTACGKSESSDKLIMGTEAGFAPYEYMSGDEVVGIDIDISNAIAESLGVELEVKNMDFDGALAAVQSGKVDFVAAGVSVTDERLEVMDFSHEYVNSTEVIVVNAADPAIADPAGADFDEAVLEGLTVAVQQGNVADGYVSEGDFGTPAEIKRYTKFAQAAEDLKNNKVDCIVMDQYPAQELVASNPELVILDGILFQDCYAIAVQKGNTELLEQINAVIDQLIADGKIEEFTANHTSSMGE